VISAWAFLNYWGGTLPGLPPKSTPMLLMAGHIQIISRVSKGSQNIFIYNFTSTTSDCQGGGISASAFALARPGVARPLADSFLVCDDHNRQLKPAYPEAI